MKLRDSARLNELRTQYDQLWHTLLSYEEKEAEKLIRDFSSQIDFHDKRKYGVSLISLCLLACLFPPLSSCIYF